MMHKRKSARRVRWTPGQERAQDLCRTREEAQDVLRQLEGRR